LRQPAREALVEQLRLSQAIDSSLVRAWSAHDEIQRVQQEREALLSPALKDSCATLATRGSTSLSGVADALSDVAVGVQAADCAPAQGLREAYRACDALVDKLIGRWRKLEPALRAAAGAPPNRP